MPPTVFKTLSFETPPALYPKPLNPNAVFCPADAVPIGSTSWRRVRLWVGFALPRRICPRFWALERPAAACVFRGLQNAHQGSSAQGFGPLRGLQQHAFSGACKTHIREALPKPGKTGGNMSRNLFTVRHERSELRGCHDAPGQCKQTTTQGQILKVQLDHAFQNVRSKNARFQHVRKLRQNVRADATKVQGSGFRV